MIILADANLPAIRQAFPTGFTINSYQDDASLHDQINDAEILICRSTTTINEKLLQHSNVKIVATTTSGTNHIDKTYLSKKNIALIDAKGANALAVRDWVMASMALLQPKFKGRQVGIIGVGCVGSAVQRCLSKLGFQILTCDPLRRTTTNFCHTPLEALVISDVILIHANLHENNPHPTANLINRDYLNKLNPECFIINAARGNIVNETDLLSTDFQYRYLTDVYANEPKINPSIIDSAMICTPHIAGHTIEAKINAVYQVSQTIHHQLGIDGPVVCESHNLKNINLSESSWAEAILTHYNPMKETLKIKASTDKSECFLSLRKQHIRHGINQFL